MKERPIIMTVASVRAILEGCKTQTRRVVTGNALKMLSCVSQDVVRHDMPKYRIGDILWVKETWHYCPHKEEVLYKATDEGTGRDFRVGSHGGWKSPMFMPRWASRVTLEITDIRVERLQDITEEDSVDEGIASVPSIGPFRAFGWKDYSDKTDGFFNPIDSFRSLWDSLNAKLGYSWESNPWVWAISFKVVEPLPEDV